MITYFDTSSLLKVLIEEEGSDRASLIWDTADALVSVALIVVESRAALAAARRGRRLGIGQHRRAVLELSALIEEMHIVDVDDELLEHASRLAEEENLRGHDAVHLAAAMAVEPTVFSSADADLCAAAQRVGLHVADPLDP